jgi:Fe-S cluster assembly iron-binding protein IscA
MIIKLDKYTCAEFLAQGAADINVDVVNSGCAGLKISVSPRSGSDERLSSEEHLGIRCWIKPELAEKLDGSQIAKTKGKYYLVSKNIQTRCGCGTSFSFEKKTVPQNFAKIHRLRNELQKSPEIQKIRENIKKTLKK